MKTEKTLALPGPHWYQEPQVRQHSHYLLICLKPCPAVPNSSISPELHILVHNSVRRLLLYQSTCQYQEPQSPGAPEAIPVSRTPEVTPIPRTPESQRQHKHPKPQRSQTLPKSQQRHISVSEYSLVPRTTGYSDKKTKDKTENIEKHPTKIISEISTGTYNKPKCRRLEANVRTQSTEPSARWTYKSLAILDIPTLLKNKKMTLNTFL